MDSLNAVCLMDALRDMPEPEQDKFRNKVGGNLAMMDIVSQMGDLVSKMEDYLNPDCWGGDFLIAGWDEFCFAYMQAVVDRSQRNEDMDLRLELMNTIKNNI